MDYASEDYKIKIWIIKAAETLPSEMDGREGRACSIARYLSDNGQEVIWWKSTFFHGEKRYLYDSQKVCNVKPNEIVISLHAKTPYKKNTSVKRIIHYKQLANEFRKCSSKMERPDLIFCAWPSIELTKAAVEYGEKNKVPVVVDIRDFWPDIFIRVFPRKTRKIGKILLFPLKLQTKFIMRRVTAITGVCDAAVAWGCNYAGRFIEKRDRTFYIGNKSLRCEDYLTSENMKFWNDLGVNRNTWNICFFGNLRSSGLDLDTLIKATLKLSEKYENIRLIIGGEGDSKNYLLNLANNSKNIVFPGFLNDQQMNSLMFISKCGAYCIKNTFDFINTFSNKAVQYLAAGLPIVNSLSGFAATLLNNYQAGLTYKEGDIEDCKEKIEFFYLNESKRVYMCQNALELFELKFNSDFINREIEEYFYSIIRYYTKEINR